MKTSNILVHDDGGEKRIITLALNRPNQRNAIDRDLLLELRKQVDILARDNGIGALIISSEITHAFCSGVDVSYVQNLSNQEAGQFFRELADVLEQITTFPCPTFAAVSGYAFGAGADLALACDLRIASSSARFRFPGPQFGLILGTRRLIHEVGPSIARMLALTGRIVDAKSALQYGLVHAVHEGNSCLEAALEWARSISEMPPYTLDTIRELCRNEYNINTDLALSLYLTEQSVLAGDFNDRFSKYASQWRKNNKTDRPDDR